MTGTGLYAKLKALPGTSQVGNHRYTILEASDPTWIDDVADEYRELRIARTYPLEDLTLNGLDVIDAHELRRHLIETQLPTRRPPGPMRHLAVERADLAEVVLGMLGAEIRDYQYGYRSSRDREVVTLPGRSIDQVGVVLVDDMLAISLGEAKVSSSLASPPAVVDAQHDSLRNQHIGHLAAGLPTAQKILAAARNSTDRVTQQLLHTAGVLWKNQRFDMLVVRCTSMLVRPTGSPVTDFGTHLTQPAHYMPGEIDFLILHVGPDIEAVVDEFLAKAREEWLEDALATTEEASGD